MEITPKQLDPRSDLAESIASMVKLTKEDIDLFKSVAQKTFTPKFFKKENVSNDLVLEKNWELISQKLVSKYEEELKPKNGNDENKKQKKAKGSSPGLIEMEMTTVSKDDQLKEAIEENKDEERKDDRAKSEDEIGEEINTKLERFRQIVQLFLHANFMLAKNAVLITVAATDPRAEKSPFIRDFLNKYRSYC